MRILLTGARGQLGTDFCRLLNHKHEITAWDLEELDITKLNDVLEAADTVKPDAIVNCAAYTNVDGCESNHDLAYRINVLGAKNLAIAAFEKNARLLHISTDFVFDGSKKSPYYEYDAANPLSVYGETKLAAEHAIRDICPKHYILRTAWLYGHHGSNFVKTMLKLSEERDELNVVDDQIGTPTFSEDLVRAMEATLVSDAYGMYHASNDGECSWLDFAQRIFSIAGKTVLVKPITSQQLNRPAVRPPYSVMKNFMLENHHGLFMRQWEEALTEYFINQA